MYREIYVAIFVIFALIEFITCIRVCPTFPQYDIPVPTGCHNNPDGESNITQIITRWGFTNQEYIVETEDGYLVSVVRGYHPTLRSRPNPIVLGHGIVTNGNYWISKGRGSLPYVLGLIGYEFWIISFRGTKYSRNHRNLTTFMNQYWEYSWYENGIYDLSSVLQKVFEVTGEKSVYLGYSMGTTVGFVYATENPAEASNLLLGMIQLAPAAYMKNITGAFAGLSYLFPTWRRIAFASEHGEALTIMRKGFLRRTFAHSSSGMLTFESINVLFFGFHYDQLDPMQIPITLSIGYDSIAVDVFVHFGQLINTGNFQKYDYGNNRNIEKYGQPTPPQFNITNINITIALFVGENDDVAKVTNARRLYDELEETSKCGFTIISDPNFNHIDFVEARDVGVLLYTDIILKLQTITTQSCTP